MTGNSITDGLIIGIGIGLVLAGLRLAPLLIFNPRTHSTADIIRRIEHAVPGMVAVAVKSDNGWGVTNMAEEVICTCGHARRQHSRDGCTSCACTVTYMDLSPRR